MTIHEVLQALALGSITVREAEQMIDHIVSLDYVKKVTVIIK